VSAELIASKPELRIELGLRTEPCAPGIQYGSRYVLTPGHGEVFDIMPQSVLNRVANVETFAGMFVFDKWTCNHDGRQAVFWRTGKQHKYTATFIDHGWCFAAGKWALCDGPRYGLYRDHSVYTGVTGWDSFEPWLSRIEAISADFVYQCAQAVPEEWYVHNRDGMVWLVEQLLRRRRTLRELITDTLRSDPLGEVFPNWRTGKVGRLCRRAPDLVRAPSSVSA
jgi:hypothetical protein